MIDYAKEPQKARRIIYKGYKKALKAHKRIGITGMFKRKGNPKKHTSLDGQVTITEEEYGTKEK